MISKEFHLHINLLQINTQLNDQGIVLKYGNITIKTELTQKLNTHFDHIHIFPKAMKTFNHSSYQGVNKIIKESTKHLKIIHFFFNFNYFFIFKIKFDFFKFIFLFKNQIKKVKLPLSPKLNRHIVLNL